MAGAHDHPAAACGQQAHGGRQTGLPRGALMSVEGEFPGGYALTAQAAKAWGRQRRPSASGVRQTSAASLAECDVESGLPSAPSEVHPPDLTMTTNSAERQPLITYDPKRRLGKPRIRGLQMTAGDVLKYMASDMSFDDILQGYPDLTREDPLACPAFAADCEHRVLSRPA